MALYKKAEFLTATDDASFDKIHLPGGTTPFSGIYRCTGCRKEIVSEEHKPLPPQNHHQHTTAQGSIRWQMAIYAQHEPTK